MSDTAVGVPVTGAPPLALPYYRASYFAAVRRFFAKYATFSGRASRAEYWWWMLTALLLGMLTRMLDGLIVGWQKLGPGPGAVEALVLLATFVPALAVTWRRLHDAGRSGLWFFFGCIPIVGTITLLVFTLEGPNPSGRRFD